MITIHKAELVISAPDRHSWPESDLPEVVLAGRSNVGKSSLINTITQRKKLAYVGNTPGKTRLLNFFNLNDQYMLVDDYFAERTQKRGLLLIVDARHKPTEDDRLMIDFARYYDLPCFVVATKMDKLKRSEIKKNLNVIKETLLLREEEVLIPFSSETKQGVDEVWDELLKLFNSKPIH